MVLTALTIFGKRELHQGKTTPRLGITKTQKMIKEVHCILKALLQYRRRHETNHSNKNHQTARGENPPQESKFGTNKERSYPKRFGFVPVILTT